MSALASFDPNKSCDEDQHFMSLSIELAKTGIGRVAPNPSVGCLIVNKNEIVGSARSADGGRPHAETQALEQAGIHAKGASLYTTLEPCGHHGVTPPCIEAIIRSGISRVVIGALDPNQQEYGCINKLQQAGIEVELGVCERECRDLNEGFFMLAEHKRPLVSGKIATSMDGRIALKNGKSKWITGEKARLKGHEFRSKNDAVMVGVRTVLEDDPMLNVRLDTEHGQPLRIVLDHDLKTPLDSALIKSAADENVLLICGSSQSETHISRFSDQGVGLIQLDSKERYFEPKAILKALAKRGITRIYIEGGGHTLTPFIKARLMDYLIWFRAGCLIGGDGLPAFQALGLENIEDMPKFDLKHSESVGEDILEIWSLRR